MPAREVIDINAVRLPKKMLRAYKHSTEEHRSLFRLVYKHLTLLGIGFYTTDCPDLRARHPLNDIVFVVIFFQEVAGTRVEIRIDSCPQTFWLNNSIRPLKIIKYDANSRARWAVYPIGKFSDIAAVKTLIEKVQIIRPEWGNRLFKRNSIEANLKDLL